MSHSTNIPTVELERPNLVRNFKLSTFEYILDTLYPNESEGSQKYLKNAVEDLETREHIDEKSITTTKNCMLLAIDNRDLEDRVYFRVKEVLEEAQSVFIELFNGCDHRVSFKKFEENALSASTLAMDETDELVAKQREKYVELLGIQLDIKNGIIPEENTRPFKNKMKELFLKNLRDWGIAIKHENPVDITLPLYTELYNRVIKDNKKYGPDLPIIAETAMNNHYEHLKVKPDKDMYQALVEKICTGLEEIYTQEAHKELPKQEDNMRAKNSLLSAPTDNWLGEITDKTVERKNFKQ